MYRSSDVDEEPPSFPPSRSGERRSVTSTDDTARARSHKKSKRQQGQIEDRHRSHDGPPATTTVSSSELTDEKVVKSASSRKKSHRAEVKSRSHKCAAKDIVDLIENDKMESYETGIKISERDSMQAAESSRRKKRNKGSGSSSCRSDSLKEDPAIEKPEDERTKSSSKPSKGEAEPRRVGLDGLIGGNMVVGKEDKLEAEDLLAKALRRDELAPSLTPDMEPPALVRNQGLGAITPGAVSVPGINGPSAGTYDEEHTVNSVTEMATLENSTLSIINARVVDEEEPSNVSGPFVVANVITEGPLDDKHEKAASENRKTKCMIALVVVIVILVIAIILFFTVSRKSSSDPQLSIDEARVAFRLSLEPLLSDESLAALDDPDSPQALSMRWLRDRSNFEVWSFQRQVQRYALATIYYSTHGVSWPNKDSWLTDADECTWPQDVDVLRSCNEGNLVTLHMHGEYMHGPLPDDIRLLTSLQVVDLSQSDISGTLPGALGELSELTLLDLTGTYVEGTLPLELASLSRLQRLYLSLNSLSGKIPESYSGLANLQELNMTGCDLDGQIPSTIGLLSNIRKLDLSENSFSGSLPSELGLLRHLSVLMASRNALEGSISYHIGYLSSLYVLDLSGNGLNGVLPSQVGFLRKLEKLDLHHNVLSGLIPVELGMCSKLQDVNLSGNNLEGDLPVEIGSLMSLKTLALFDNFLQGEVPPQVCALTSSTGLSLLIDCGSMNCTCCRDEFGNQCVDNTGVSVSSGNNTNNSSEGDDDGEVES